MSQTRPTPSAGKRRTPRLACAGAAALITGLALTGGGARRVPDFAGEIALFPNTPERVCIRQHAGGASAPRGVRTDLGPGEIGFAHAPARDRLVADARYDALTLPFALELEQTAVIEAFPARDTLSIDAPGGVAQVPAVPGQTIMLPSGPAYVRGVRPWQGLIRAPDGPPMAVAALQHEDASWGEGVFVAAGKWTAADGATRLHLAWHASRHEAEDAARAGLDSLNAARWGIQHGGATTWFTSFERGAGMDLPGGGRVVLLDRRDTPEPAVYVGLVQGGNKEAGWFPVNKPGPIGRIRFEDPSRCAQVYVLHAWTDGMAIVCAYREGKRVDCRAVETWQQADFSGDAPALRLEQLLSAAAPVARDDSPLYEAVLDAPEGMVRIRQGEAVRRGSASIVYQREAPPPRLAYHVRVLSGNDASGHKHILAPGGAFTQAGWRFTQKPGGGASCAVLEAQHRRRRPLWLVGGAFIAAAGAVCLAAALRGRKIQS